MAIMGRGMDFTGRIGPTVVTLIGAGTIITGTKQDLCRGGCSSRHAGESGDAFSAVRLLGFCFDFGKSRLLQLLIERGKIGLQ